MKVINQDRDEVIFVRKAYYAPVFSPNSLICICFNVYAKTEAGSRKKLLGTVDDSDNAAKITDEINEKIQEGVAEYYFPVEDDDEGEDEDYV